MQKQAASLLMVASVSAWKGPLKTVEDYENDPDQLNKDKLKLYNKWAKQMNEFTPDPSQASAEAGDKYAERVMCYEPADDSGIPIKVANMTDKLCAGQDT